MAEARERVRSALAVSYRDVSRFSLTVKERRLPLTVLSLAIAAFLVWTHRSNLQKHFGPRPTRAA